MNTVQKWGAGLIAVAMVTTMVLPKRQTPAVIGAIDKLIRGSLGTAMGTAKAA